MSSLCSRAPFIPSIIEMISYLDILEIFRKIFRKIHDFHSFVCGKYVKSICSFILLGDVKSKISKTNKISILFRFILMQIEKVFYWIISTKGLIPWLLLVGCFLLLLSDEKNLFQLVYYHPSIYHYWYITITNYHCSLPFIYI